MVIDMRYHIVSLVAVFLALGLGMLIGSSLLSNERMFEEQKKLVARLEQDLSGIRQENRQLTAELTNARATEIRWQKFGEAVLPLLVAERLTDRQIALVKTTDSLSDQAVNQISECLKLAGATVSSVTTIKRPFLATDEEEQEKVLDFLGLGDGESALQNLELELATLISRNLVHGLGQERLATLEELEFLSLEGQYASPVDTVVVIGGRKDKSKEQLSFATIDRPLLDALQPFNLEVVGAEPAFVTGENSYITHYRAKRLLTIDNIDTVEGQIALVFALATHNQGSYGIKETAQHFLPPLVVEGKNR